LERVMYKELRGGRLQGLLFGSPQRFLSDLVMELRTKAAYEEFIAASESNQVIVKPFGAFVAASAAWQEQHGYQCYWNWPGMRESLEKLHSPAVDAVLNPKIEGQTPFDRIADHFRMTETYTVRLLEAMEVEQKKMTV
jgi:hypothetical protein